MDYNFRSAQAVLGHVGEYDLFYVNDFQQILVGGLVGASAPALLRWLIPLEFRGYPEPVRRFFLKAMEGFDAIVVSTRNGLEELIRHGFHGRAFQVYPYVDPSEYPSATESEIGHFRDRFGLGDAPYILAVGRHDPVKRQDLLIDAFARVRRKFPDHRLVMVGGGSFTSQQLSAGRGRDKAAVWESMLIRSIRRNRLENRVVLTGNVSAAEVRAAYGSAQVFVHPAPWEGFGLVVLEAWMNRLPVIVSRGAGVAELVSDGINGFAVPPGSVATVASRLEHLLRHPNKAERMGEEGAVTAPTCYVERAAPRLRKIFHRTIQLYGRIGHNHDRSISSL